MPGVADLPLHGGRVPAWMLRVMEKLAESIVRYMVEVRGPSAILAMLADPLWFQAFNNVIGMDWDSSGSTTVVTGVLKTVTWRDPSLGILVLGGKGARMRRVPEEAVEASRLYGVDPGVLERASRIAARADSSFLQDGYTLYHHTLILSSEGDYIVVQQGMNTRWGTARRYHVDRFQLEEPHSGVAGVAGRGALNATAKESGEARRIYLEILGEGPSRIVRLLGEANRVARGQPSLLDYMDNGGAGGVRDRIAYYKPIPLSRSLIRAIEQVASDSPISELDLALKPGIGPRLVRALALIADLIYGVPTSTRDPITHPLDPYLYAYAVGGKDKVPYPFDAKTAIEAIEFLREAVLEARIEGSLKARVLKRLHSYIRGLRGDY